MQRHKSAWHTTWQSKFDAAEVRFCKTDGCTSARRADAVVCGGSLVVEFQHSWITRAEVDARNHDYGCHGKQVMWVVDGNTDVRVTHLENADAYLFAFHDADWKYSSFLACDRVYVHVGEHVHRFAPRDVRSHMIDVRAMRVAVEDFVLALNTSRSLDALATCLDGCWNDGVPMPQSNMYVNQRGAGCGKTYESVRLPLIGGEFFEHKRRFIYLTKAHTAKTVIRDELEQQLQKEDGVLVEAGKWRVFQTGKQYAANLERRRDGAYIEITIGTVDSFVFALGDRASASAENGDMFRNLCDSISKGGYQGYTYRGGFRYAQDTHYLDKECLVVVDEAQDLPNHYMEALAALQRDTYVDVYVIGDKLQSLWGAHNIFTEGLPNTDIIKTEGANVVRRFHCKDLMDYVNGCVRFEQYGLSPIVGICDGARCGYPHGGDGDAVELLEQPSYKAEKKEFIKEIMNHVRAEVARHQYLPRNFMFIFPIMASNELAAQLETALDDFWIKRFNDPEYREKVLARDPFWRDRMDEVDAGFHRHAMLHKSVENQPINLDESRQSTRLLSIHASKGQGCEVVFLLGVTEDALKKFSKNDENDIVYESLLHVALTRMKQKLYIGMGRKDDVYARFNHRGEFVRKNDDDDIVNNVVKGPAFSNFVTQQVSWYNEIDKAFFAPHDIYESVPDSDGKDRKKEDRVIIEWGDHTIRKNVALFTLWHNIRCMTLARDGAAIRQAFKIMDDLAKKEVKSFPRKEYYEQLHEIRGIFATRRGEIKTEYRLLPVLDVTTKTKNTTYARLTEKLKSIIEHVKRKLVEYNRGRRSVQTICPIEMCVWVHVICFANFGDCTTFSIHELYRILHSVASATDTRHDGYDCICNEILCGSECCTTTADKEDDTSKATTVQQSIVNHHLSTAKMSAQLAAMMNYLRTTLDDPTTVEFLVKHKIVFEGCSLKVGNNFRLQDRSDIVAFTERNVVLCSVCPTFNRLNRDAVLVNALYATFIARNVHPTCNNYVRFNGKRVSVCVFTFSSDDPVWLHMDYDDDTVIRDCLAAYLKQTFTKMNEELWAMFQDDMRSHGGLMRQVFDKMEARFDDKNGVPKYSVPKYLSAFFKDAKERSKKEKRCVLQGVEDLHAELDKRIREFLYPDDDVW